MKATKVKRVPKEHFWVLSNGKFHLDERDQRGKRVRATWKDRAQARRESRTIMTAIADESFVNPNSPCASFGVFLPEFHANYTGRNGEKPRTDTYVQHGESLKPFFGHIPVADGREQEWRDADKKYKAHMLARGLPKQYAKTMASARTILSFAKRLNYASRNPLDAAGIVIPAASSDGRVDYFSKDRIDSETGEKILGTYRPLLIAAPDWLALKIRFSIATGFRLKEVTGLCWKGGVDLDAGVVKTTKDCKAGKVQSVKLCKESRAVLAERKQRMMQYGYRSEYVFCNDAGIDYHNADPETGLSGKDRDYRHNVNGERQPCRTNINRAVRVACDAIGKPEANFHVCRHTCASWLVQAGVPLLTVKEVMRHASITMTEKYAHLAPDQHKQALDALDAAFAVAR